MRLPTGQKDPIPRNLPTKMTPPVGSQAEIVEPSGPAGPPEALPSDSSQHRGIIRHRPVTPLKDLHNTTGRLRPGSRLFFHFSTHNFQQL